MKTRGLFVILCICFAILISIKETKAYTQETFKNHEVLVQNKLSGESYPIVGNLETKVFGRNYPEDDIYNRLERMELKLFGTLSKKELSDRVEDLSKAVTGAGNNSDGDDYFGSHSDDDLDSYTERDVSLNNLLNQLEKKLLNQIYPNDSKEERVARLERFIFNGSSDGFPMDERIERIATVVKAQPTNEIYQDVGKLGNPHSFSTGMSLATIILMILAGLLL